MHKQAVRRLCGSGFVLLLGGASVALGQQYSISTVAGGAPPPTPVPALSTTIGQPRRATTDSAGNLYFSSGNTVFKMSGTTLTVFAGNSRAGFSGDGGPAVNAQLNSPQGLVFDAAGNFYIADAGNNRVRIVGVNGIINTFAGNGAVGAPRFLGDGGPAVQANLHLPSGVAVDSSGNVYIADTGDNCIRKVTTDGNIASVAGDGFPSYLGDVGSSNPQPATMAELHSPEDVALDSSGNIYIADSANAAIREVTTDGNISTIAGNATIGYSGDGGAATKAGLTAPFALALDSSGNIFFVENGDSRIRKVDTKGNISTVVGNGTAGFTGDGSQATSAELNWPTGLALDSSNNLYIADTLNARIRKVASGNITTIAGNGGLAYSGDNGPATQAQLNSPWGVALDAAGNFYIADTYNNVVRKVAKNGIITPFAGNGKAGNGGDGGAATSAQLSLPQGLAVDTAGNVYIADSGNNKVRKVSTDGTISTVAGSGTAGSGGDGGSAGAAQLSGPLGVAVDTAGNLYIADFGNNRVRKVVSSGTITTVAGVGTQGYTGDGGAATSAQLNLPQGVAVDNAGGVYIADTGNSVIRKVSGGVINTVAGSGVPGHAGDQGPATSALLSNPTGVAVDTIGNIYIADGGTNVRKVFPNGIIVSIAGNATHGYSGDGGVATSAQMNNPSQVALDPNGNLYVADTGNNAIRLLQFTSSGIKINGVTNGASNQTGAIAPGEVVVLYGAALGPAQLALYQPNSDGSVPFTTGGASVVINGAFAPVLYSSASQVAAVVPFGVTGSQAQVFVQYNGESSPPVTVSVAGVAPAVFTLNGSGTGQAAAINNVDGSVNGSSHPANAGDYVSLYATGLGQTNPPGQDGALSAVPLPLAVASVSVTIGGKTANVNYAGGAPGIVAGVMQVNAQVPSGLMAGNAPVVILVNNTPTQSGVTVAVSGN